MTKSKFAWIIAVALELGLAATSSRAQLHVDDPDRDAFVSFRGSRAQAVAQPGVTFDFQLVGFGSDARSDVTTVLGFGHGASTVGSLLLLPNFNEGLTAEAEDAPVRRFQSLPVDSLRIPEPGTYGIMGILTLFGLTTLHRVRRKSAGLAA